MGLTGIRDRTLLLLGGSRQQVVAIESARACGYRTVLCDYLPDNPGQYSADVYYPVSTTDREEILKVAKREAVEGIIAYSSDPAAPTAAYVAEKLGLPTNPLAAVEVMSTKTLFRKHMERAGVPCPRAAGISKDIESIEVERLVEGFSFPVVVKPTDSSGSKGVTVVKSRDELTSAIRYAALFSRNGKLIVEEYIDRVFPFVIGGDIFIVDGVIRFWGLMSCLRDDAFPLVPVGERIPSGLSETRVSKVKAVLQQLVTSLDIEFGELNVEVMIGKNDTPYVVELGARAGGNMIPVQLSDASGIDLVRANVRCAMGDDPGDVSWDSKGECYATYVLHSSIDGIYMGYRLSPVAATACYRKVIYQEPGTLVETFDGANKALGILFFRFDSYDEMCAIMSHAENHISVEVNR